MRKIRKDDTVIALAGNEKGRTGTVLSVDNDRVVVQGLNVRKKHTKGRGNEKGQILQIEAPLHISNLRVCTSEGKPVKLKVRFNEKSEKELYYIEGGQEVTYRTMKQTKG